MIYIYINININILDDLKFYIFCIHLLKSFYCLRTSWLQIEACAAQGGHEASATGCAGAPRGSSMASN